jgi:hypothetical protein
MKKDNSTGVGGRRNSVGDDYSAGNSVAGSRKSMAGNNVQAVKDQASRFKKTRTRRGKTNAIV